MRTLDIDECAEFLKINASTASEMAAAGELPGAKIGRAWVFLLDDLVEYLRAKVRQQQRERQADVAVDNKLSKAARGTEPAILANLKTVSEPRRSRRNPIPNLDGLPELVSQV